MEELTNALSSGLYQSPFPSEEKVLKDFYKKNKLPKPTRIIKTHKGLLAFFEEDYVILSKEDSKSNLNPILQPLIGGDGTTRYTSQETNYTLEGKLSGKKILLNAEISYTERYKKHSGVPNPMMRLRWEKTGRNETDISRKDNNKEYWFLKNPD